MLLGAELVQPAFTTVEEYDPVTDTWTPKSPMQLARGFLSTSVVNGKIYAMGGVSGPNSFLPTVEEYDPVTDTWTMKNPMSTSRGGFCSSVVDNKIYVIGGGEQGFSAPMDSVKEYDPVTDTWKTGTAMLTARSLLSASTVNGKIYVIGGSLTALPSATPTDIVEEYDPSLDPTVPVELVSFTR